jgi:hypothetical protein
MEKNTIKISLLIFAALLLSSSIDLILSYNYYIINPERFFEFEGNTEFVNYLKNGAIPINNIIKFVISLPIILFILSWFDLLKNFINNDEYLMKYLENIGRFSTIIISLLFCILYLFSGFTWYDNSIFSFNNILSIIEILINISVGLVMFLLFIISFYVLFSEIRVKINIQ